MSKIRSGVNFMTRFVTPGDKHYSEYINYMDREAASRKENIEKYSAFTNDRTEQAQAFNEHPAEMSNLFSDCHDSLSKEEKKKMQKSFRQAQDKKSPMWQNVFSFDNRYLKELGLYDLVGRPFLDDAALREATRVAMNKMMFDMKLGSKVEWTAAIHYNTENIHVHVGMVVQNPEDVLLKRKEDPIEYRAKIPPKTVRNMKSVYANSIAKRDVTLARISELMRQEVAEKSFQIGYSDDIQLLRSINSLMRELPSNRKLWRYNNNAMMPFRERIDGITRKITQKNSHGALKELDVLLEKESKFFELTYGERAKYGNDGKTYEDNKRQELNALLGNRLLREMSSTLNTDEWKNSLNMSNEQFEQYMRIKRNAIGKQQLNKIQYALSETTQDYLNKRTYLNDRWQRERKEKLEREQGRGYV